MTNIQVRYIKLDLMMKLKAAREREDEILRLHGGNMTENLREELARLSKSIIEIEARLDQFN